MRSAAGAAVAAVLVVALLAGCGSSKSTSSNTTVAGVATGSGAPCPTTETASLAKTKFVLHAGLASGAFYHWIFEPMRAGAFRSGHSGRLRAILKAGLAAAFVVHELRVARTDAAQDPTLCKIVVHPIDTIETAFSSVEGKVKRGSASDSDLAPVDQGITSMKQQSAQAGSPVTDQTPTAGQLANPSSTGS